MLVSYFFSSLLFVSLFWFIYHYKKIKYDVYRYKLFAVRDKFIKYAIDGKIDLNSKGAIYMQHVINNLIKYLKNYDLLLISQQIEEVVQYSTKKKRKFKNIYTEIKKNEYLVEILSDTLNILMELLVKNSFILRIVIKWNKIVIKWNKKKNKKKKVNTMKIKSFEIYNYINSIKAAYT